MAEEKTMRLSQVACKLNVGTATMTTHLIDKGFQIENKPNTKITLEQYKILAEAFADATIDKEEASELNIGKSYDSEPTLVLTQKQDDGALTQDTKELRVSGSLAEQHTAASQPTHGDYSPIAKKTSLAASIYPTKPVNAIPPSKARVLKEPEKLQGPKVLGKIELTETVGKRFQQAASSDVRQAQKKLPRKRIIKKSDPINKVHGKIIKQEKAGPSEKKIQEQIKNTLAKLDSRDKGATGRAKYRKGKRTAIAEARAEELLQAQEAAKTLQVTEFISANDLASLIGVSINEVLSVCMSLGMVVSINQRLDAEAITIIVDEFGYQVEFTDIQEQTLEEDQEQHQDLVERAPIVTIMGHVDHGKTSLLDYIRNTQITKGEAGGITQHIGAYDVVTEKGERIAFLDTPGHEAFTAMRARGTKLTDIAIVVVAADDGVRPQTKEAINHAQLAGVPIVIAINKIDKPQANPEKVKEELANINVLIEDWGGKYQSQTVSAKTGEGISKLLEKILFEAELLELKADPYKRVRGTVIEASLDQGRGYLTTVMVQAGTLKIGNIVLAGAYYGRVKAMFDYQGKPVKEAVPSTPVQILGINGTPQAGDSLREISSDKEARAIATQRQQILREQGLRTKTHITLDEVGRRLAIGNFKELNIILKGDVDGSVEALSDALLKLSTEEIKVNILHKGVGAIAESDILLAAASDAIVIGFQVRPSATVRKMAEKEGIEIRLYAIIYDAIDNVKDALQGMLAPTIEEVLTGNAIVREIFKITSVGTVAGCYVTDGYIKKANQIRLIRDGIVVYTGSIKQLKRFKEELQQVKASFECGISIDSFNDIKIDDAIEGFESKEIERKL